MTKRILGLAVAAVVVLGVAGAALAAEPDPPPPGSRGKKQELQACVRPKVDGGADRQDARRECAAQLGLPPNGAKRDRLPAVGKAAHAELVVPKRDAAGEWETVIVDRGKVTAASADSISLQRPDGPTVTIRVVAGTKVRGAASAADLAPGREAKVVSAGGEARSIAARG